MHASISGTVDFREADDPACLARIRSIVEKWGYRRQSPWDRKKPLEPALRMRKKFTAFTILRRRVLTI